MLAIDWNSKRLRIVEGRIARGQVKWGRALSIELPDSLDRSDADALGMFLKEQLRQAGISDRQAVSSVDRRNIVFKSASLVGVADDEVPDVVRLQAMRDLTLPIEDSTVDYVRVEPSSQGEEPYALIAVARNDVIDVHRKILSAAGLRFAGLWPGPLAQVHAAVASPVMGKVDPDAYHLLLVCDQDSVELTLLRGDHCLMSVSRPIGARHAGAAEAASPVLQAIRRLKPSLSTQYPNLQLHSILCAGFEEPEGQLSAEVAGEFGAPVEWFDPLAGFESLDLPAEQRGGFTDAVGSLLLAAKPAVQRIDFLSPKKAKVRTDRRRIAVLVAVGALLTAGFQIHRYRQSQMDQIAAKIAAAKQKEKSLQKQLKALAGVEAKAAMIKEWREQDVVWLNVLQKFTQTLPPPKRIFITTMNLTRSNRPVGPAATMRLEGYADSAKTVSDFMHRLTAQAKFEVRPGAMQPASQFEGYPWRFSADVSIPRNAAQEPAGAESLAGR